MTCCGNWPTSSAKSAFRPKTATHRPGRGSLQVPRTGPEGILAGEPAAGRVSRHALGHGRGSPAHGSLDPPHHQHSPLGTAQPSAAGSPGSRRRADVAYRTDPQADPFRHCLDLFYPKGKKAYPVLVLVHGGGWMLGDNRCCGLYSSVGQFLASQGIGVVLPNYRLSPGVKHPAARQGRGPGGGLDARPHRQVRRRPERGFT